jgi:hypothetical protein
VNPTESLRWLARNGWSAAQIAGVARVSTTAVRSWLQWKAAIPTTPGLRLMVAAYAHRVLLVYLEPPSAPTASVS